MSDFIEYTFECGDCGKEQTGSGRVNEDFTLTIFPYCEECDTDKKMKRLYDESTLTAFNHLVREMARKYHVETEEEFNPVGWLQCEIARIFNTVEDELVGSVEFDKIST